jgi:hypothetical protein
MCMFLTVTIITRINLCQHYKKVIYILNILHQIYRRISHLLRGIRGRGRIVVGFITTDAISGYNN